MQLIAALNARVSIKRPSTVRRLNYLAPKKATVPSGRSNRLHLRDAKLKSFLDEKQGIAFKSYGHSDFVALLNDISNRVR
jgi:hypothetical protein